MAKRLGLGEWRFSGLLIRRSGKIASSLSKALSLDAFSQGLGKIRQIMTEIFLLALLIVPITLLIHYLREKDILIEHFEVSEPMAKQGFTGEAVARQLLDQLKIIRDNAETDRKQLIFSSSQHQLPSWEVAGATISLDSWARALGEFVGLEKRRVNGEVLLDRDVLSVAVRVSDNPARTFSTSLKGRDQASALTFLLRQAARSVYEFTDAYYLASFLFETNDDEGALEALSICLQNDLEDDDSWAYTLWGLILVREGKSDAAIEKFERAISLRRDFDAPYFGLGDALAEQGRYLEAAKRLQDGLTQQSPDGHFALGLYYLAADRIDKAEQNLDRAAEEDHQWGSPHQLLSRCYLKRKGREKEAIAALRKAVLLSPDWLDAYTDLAHLPKGLISEVDRQLALETWAMKMEKGLLHTVEVNPESVSAWIDLADFYFNQQKQEKNGAKGRYLLSKAESAFQAAIELDQERLMAPGKMIPDPLRLVRAYKGRGVAFAEQGKYNEALDDFSKALKLSPDNSAALMGSATALLQLGRYKESLVWFQKAEALGSNLTEKLKPNECLALRKLGRTREVTLLCGPGRPTKP